MKKIFALLIALCMLFSAAAAMADIADDVAAGQAMSHDELVAAAQAETGGETL